MEGVNSKFAANVLEMSQHKGPASLLGEKCIQNTVWFPYRLSFRITEKTLLSGGRPHSPGGSLWA